MLHRSACAFWDVQHEIDISALGFFGGDLPNILFNAGHDTNSLAELSLEVVAQKPWAHIPAVEGYIWGARISIFGLTNLGRPCLSLAALTSHGAGSAYRPIRS